MRVPGLCITSIANTRAWPDGHTTYHNGLRYKPPCRFHIAWYGALGPYPDPRRPAWLPAGVLSITGPPKSRLSPTDSLGNPCSRARTSQGGIFLCCVTVSKGQSHFSREPACCDALQLPPSSCPDSPVCRQSHSPVSTGFNVAQQITPSGSLIVLISTNPRHGGKQTYL